MEKKRKERESVKTDETEEQVDEASQSMARMSFHQPDDEMEDTEEKRTAAYA